MVTRRFNTVLEEMQNRWAKEREERPYRAQVEPAKEGPVGPSDSRLTGSVSESLPQLGSQMQRLSTAVTDLQARAGVQAEGRAVRHPLCLPRWILNFQQTTMGPLVLGWPLATRRRWSPPFR